VRAEGLEPSSSLEHRHLKPARFPFRHARAHRDPTGSSGDEMSVMLPNLASYRDETEALAHGLATGNRAVPSWGDDYTS
jgi:hypothetical protein